MNGKMIENVLKKVYNIDADVFLLFFNFFVMGVS